MINFAFGQQLCRRGSKKRFWIAIGVAFNISLLGYYKYSDFFISNLFSALGQKFLSAENIILPLAISFFTFQQIAYLIAVYRDNAQRNNLLNYLPWHPQDCYYFAAENGGFKAAPERTAGTYSKYSSIDDKIDDLHYYTTFIKFGIGRATYDASQEVRNSDITRDEAVALVARYDGEYSDRFEKEVFDYLSITEKEFGAVSGLFEQPIMDKELFDLITDQFRSPHIWQLVDGSWKLRATVY